MPEITTIVLHIARPKVREFEALFKAEEIPIWDDFTSRGRFWQAALVRVAGGNQQRAGVQDYILYVVAADDEAHGEHDQDPRFNAFLDKARRWQPEPPLVWFGQPVFERRSGMPTARSAVKRRTR